MDDLLPVEMQGLVMYHACRGLLAFKVCAKYEANERVAASSDEASVNAAIRDCIAPILTVRRVCRSFRDAYWLPTDAQILDNICARYHGLYLRKAYFIREIRGLWQAHDVPKLPDKIKSTILRTKLAWMSENALHTVPVATVGVFRAESETYGYDKAMFVPRGTVARLAKEVSPTKMASPKELLDIKIKLAREHHAAWKEGRASQRARLVYVRGHVARFIDTFKSVADFDNYCRGKDYSIGHLHVLKNDAINTDEELRAAYVLSTVYHRKRLQRIRYLRAALALKENAGERPTKRIKLDLQ